MPKKSRLILALAALLITSTAAAATQYPPQKTLRPFKNEAELAALFDKWAEERARRDSERRARSAQSPSQLGTASAAAPAGLAKAEAMADSVTNVQHAGVDEGGIVKLHGDYLVIL